MFPYRNATNIFLPIFDLKKNISYFKILMNLRTYITHNENIASFNVLHEPFIMIYQLFWYWILAYETRLEANFAVPSTPILCSLENVGKTGFYLPGTWIPLIVPNDEVCD
jgi:hypothetical protein